MDTTLEIYAPRCLLDVLYEDALVRICRFLPATSLVHSGVTCSEFHARAQESIELWKGLCSFTLGEASLLMHEKCWSSVAIDSGSVGFYRRLFQAAWCCQNFCYDHACRHRLLSSLPSRCDDVASDALCMSGHTSEALGPFVLQIGGMRNNMGSDDIINVTVINVEDQCILIPKLSHDSLKPAQRMRHSTCVVRAPFLPEAAVPEAILVLGGHDGNIHSPSAGTPRQSVTNLLFLQMTSSDGSEVRWTEESASGDAPTYIYNHASVSFREGRRACVFGGDIPASDSEFERIHLRHACNFVYILNVSQRHWEVVTTFGEVPVWRSFHAAVGYTSLRDGIDYLITFGGTDEHCEPLSGGSLADMRGYRLNLHNMHWCRGPSDGCMPSSRLRFGVARWGHHLILHGGHGHGTHGPFLQKPMARLNLFTLRWGTLSFSNAEPPLPTHSFQTGSPVAGCVVGGANFLLGPTILSRLVVFRLRDNSVLDDGMSEPIPNDNNSDENIMARIRTLQREVGEDADMGLYLQAFFEGHRDRDPQSDSDSEMSH